MNKQTFTNEFNACWNLLLALEEVEDQNKWHPEANAFQHSLQVFYKACRETTDYDLLMAALFHDVGKSIEMHGHEKHSVNLLKAYPFIISDKTLWLIDNHIKIIYYLNGEMNAQMKSIAFPAHPWFVDLVRLRRFDLKGRKKQVVQFDKSKIIDTFCQLFDPNTDPI